MVFLPVYLLAPAVPEFLAIFAGDSISAARTIVVYESSLNLTVYGLGFVGILAFASFSPATVWLGAVLAVILALLLWSLFYVFTHKGNSADHYALFGFHLLDSLFIWGLILLTLASYF